MSVLRSLSVLLLPLIFLLAVPVQAFVGGIAVSIGRATNIEGAEIPPFSADAQIETEEHQISSHVYYKPGMVRDVMDMGGMEMVTIQRYDQGKVWVLMGPGVYMEREIGEAEQAPEYKLVERTLEGTEMVDGVQTKKYKTIYEGPDGRLAGLTWFTDDNIAIKGFIVSETNGEKQRIKWTMTNVQRGDQPAALFELPPGAKPMGGMGGLMNMMGGMTGMGGTAPASAPDPNAAGETSLQDTATSVLKGVTKGFGDLFGK
jgi:hypothetical protein